MRPRTVAIVVASAAVLVAAVIAYGFVVPAANATADHGANTLPQRARAARLAKLLQPWNGAADVRYAMLQGRLLFNARKWDAAQALEYSTYLRHLGNEPLRAELRVVNLAIQVRDIGKAHVQHGHEGPGGTLRPQDYVP